MKSLIAAFAMATCITGTAMAQETIKVSGSTTVEANLFKPYHKALENFSGQKVKVNGNGSSRGIIDLFKGTSDMAMISAPLKDVLEKIDIHSDGLDAASLKVHKIGETEIQFGSHTNNLVVILSKKEIKQALSGYKTNWKEFGGEDLPITVVTEYQGGGFRTVVEKKLLHGAEFANDLVEGKTGKDIINLAKQHEGAIVVATKKILHDTQDVREIKTDFKLTQPLFFVTKGEPTKEQKEVIKTATELLNYNK